MNFTLTTPALLFPAISLLLLAYTNRFLTLAGRIRELCDRDKGNGKEHFAGQIENLRKRVYIIRRMQLFGVVSFFLCVATMLLIFLNQIKAGEITFVASLGCLLISLGMSIREIGISVTALEIMMEGK
ncbi:MAG: DUF2721 domain-containing protein [Spirochaetales bacterium]|nr:DUF2721 domain-containing protein [Spirochaetales bacterium]